MVFSPKNGLNGKPSDEHNKTFSGSYWHMNMQPEEQMQLWLLSLLFDQTVTTENTQSLAVFRQRHTDARPAPWHHLIDIHN